MENIKENINEIIIKKKPIIAICIPMCSRNQSWKSLHDCAFIKYFLPSFLRTAERQKYEYRFYLGYDKGDDFFEKYDLQLKNRLNENDKIYCKNTFHKNPCGYWNFLFKEALNDGADYFSQFGDDIIILSNNWTSYYIKILNKQGNYGITGGIDPQFWAERQLQAQSGIIENIFFHKNNFNIINNLFNKHLKTWWSDDYVTGFWYNLAHIAVAIYYKNQNRVGNNNKQSRYTPDETDSIKWKKYLKNDHKNALDLINNNKIQIDINYLEHLKISI